MLYWGTFIDFHRDNLDQISVLAFDDFLSLTNDSKILFLWCQTDAKTHRRRFAPCAHSQVCTTIFRILSNHLETVLRTRLQYVDLWRVLVGETARLPQRVWMRISLAQCYLRSLLLRHRTRDRLHICEPSFFTKLGRSNGEEGYGSAKKDQERERMKMVMRLITHTLRQLRGWLRHKVAIKNVSWTFVFFIRHSPQTVLGPHLTVLLILGLSSFQCYFTKDTSLCSCRP